MEYLKYIIFPWFHEFKVERGPDNGGEKTFNNIEELVADYESRQLHPGDLKPALSKALNKILQPVRDHFKNDPTAKELLKRVKVCVCSISLPCLVPQMFFFFLLINFLMNCKVHFSILLN
ncbi:unnamed protein product [Camellia sinensis]